MFSNDRIIKLLSEEFIPVTNNVSFSQRQQDAEGEFFRLVAEQGHYQGRTFPSDTRQGLYVAAPDGTLIRSLNTTDRNRLFRMLNRALEIWKSEDRTADVDFAREIEKDSKYHFEFPERGMALRVTVRDLPREVDEARRDDRFNFDYMWLTEAEKLSLVPEGIEAGQEFAPADQIVRRIARFHLIDHVRGESPSWKESHIEVSEFTCLVKSVDDSQVELEFKGQVKSVRPPSGRVNPYTNLKLDKDCGIELQLTGYATFVRDSDSFKQFEILATGSRWGTTMYNFRGKDMGPAPIAIAFTRLDPEPQNLVPPKFVPWNYMARDYYTANEEK